MNKALAFVKRDYLLATSYKIVFLFQVVSIATWIPILRILHTGFEGSEGVQENFDGDFFSFTVVGVSLMGYMGISLRTFNQSIRDSQLMGTLEITLLSPTSVTQLLIYSSLWTYLFTTIRFGFGLFLGTFFGLSLANANPFSALAVLALAVPAFASFGMLTATFVMVAKRGEALNGLLAMASGVFGGVFFPADKMPEWMQVIANLLPLTPAAEAMRAAVFEGASITDILPQLGSLALFTFVLLPIALGSFTLAVRWSKANGTLAQY
jgi:ABC-2 type transport system permease protein